MIQNHQRTPTLVDRGTYFPNRPRISNQLTESSSRVLRVPLLQCPHVHPPSGMFGCIPRLAVLRLRAIYTRYDF